MSCVLKRLLIPVALLAMLTACSSGSSGGADRAHETPFSSIGDPVGNELGQVLFTVPDSTGQVDVRIQTLGRNPAGSPVSCGRSEHAAGTSLVPVYINGQSHDPKTGVADVEVKIDVESDGVSYPLLLTKSGGRYVPTCAATPNIRLDGMKAGVQRVIRGVAVVKRGARLATVVLTTPDGSIRRSDVRV